MKIVNPWMTWDYHMHTLNFSDWLNTIDEMVKFAWEIWLKEIAITDHSDVCYTNYVQKHTWSVSSRSVIRSWWNVHNDVNVIFWVEWDLLNEDWDCCFTIQEKESDFIVLSAHSLIYSWLPDTIMKAYENAIKRYHDKIKFIAHPCSKSNYSTYTDIKKLCDICNDYGVALELNWKVLADNNMDHEKQKIVFENIDKLYVNSDAHTLLWLRDNRKISFEYLKKHWY